MSLRRVLALVDPVNRFPVYTCTGMGSMVSGSSAHPEITTCVADTLLVVSSVPIGFPASIFIVLHPRRVLVFPFPVLIA